MGGDRGEKGEERREGKMKERGAGLQGHSCLSPVSSTSDLISLACSQLIAYNPSPFSSFFFHSSDQVTARKTFKNNAAYGGTATKPISEQPIRTITDPAVFIGNGGGALTRNSKLINVERAVAIASGGMYCTYSSGLSHLRLSL